jgi:predicted MFS family arabinose efflux permease
MPTGLYGLLFAVTGLAGLGGSVVAARLARRTGPQLLTIAGGGGIVVSSSLLPLAAGPVPVAAGLAVLGLGLPVAFGAIANIGLTVVVTDCVPEHRLGRVIGNLRALCTGAEVIGSLAGGGLGELLGLRSAIWLCAGAGLAGGLFLLALVPTLRTKPETGVTGSGAAQPAPAGVSGT